MSLALIPSRLGLLALLGAFLTCQVQAGVPEVGGERGGVDGGTKVKPVDASQPAGRGGDVLGDGCNIAIGNVFEQAKPGFGTSARAQTTVVVQGDVIMANNRCK